MRQGDVKFVRSLVRLSIHETEEQLFGGHGGLRKEAKSSILSIRTQAIPRIQQQVFSAGRVYGALMQRSDVIPQALVCTSTDRSLV